MTYVIDAVVRRLFKKSFLKKVIEFKSCRLQKLTKRNAARRSSQLSDHSFAVKKLLPYLVVAVVASLFTTGILWAVAPRMLQSANPQSASASEPQVTAADFKIGVNESFGPNSFINASKKISAAVVNIDTVSVVSTAPNIPDEFRDFFPADIFGGEQKQVQGAGSGFIIRSDGYILTNEHVVRDAQGLKITLTNGKKYDGKVVGADAQTDLAVVKINARDLPVVEMGDSRNLVPGQWVIAIGNPYGLHGTVTAGIISALQRSLEDPEQRGQLIQTDAAINPGNSGGPLVDLSGKVIGINEAIISNSQGLGFAIPVNLAKTVSADLIAKGRVQRPATPWLGVAIGEVTDQIASYYGLANTNGAIIQIYSKGPAAKAGLMDGDIIVQINRQKIKSPDDVSKIVKQSKVGQVLDVMVYRDGKPKVFKVRLEERPQQSQQQRSSFNPFGG